MSTPVMLTVSVGRELAGFILARGRAGDEAFDRDENSLGRFKSAAEAANVIVNRDSDEGTSTG